MIQSSLASGKQQPGWP